MNNELNLQDVGKKGRPKPHEALALCIFPWVVFTGIICVFFLPPDIEGLAWVFVSICGLLSLLFVLVGYMGSGVVPFTLGALCLASVAVSVPVGLQLRGAYMHEYWRLDGGQTYRNVDPVESFSTHSDATMVEFNPSVSVDVQKSVGYMKAGQVYCVAPIIGSTSPNGSSFWAAGMNCCGDRGNFQCGDIDDASAHAITVFEDSDGYFANAMRMATSVYGLAVVPNMIPGYWVKNLDAYKDGLAWAAGIRASVVILVFLVSSIAAGIFVLRRLPGKKY